MSLYGEYIKERLNRNIVENEDGFATFSFCGADQEECYIIDIYVVLEKRKEGIASKLADEIAEKARLAGCKYLSGSVDPLANNSTNSIKALLAYGFSIAAVANGLIWFKKEL